MAELIIALDFENIEDCEKLCDKAGDAVRWYKIGSVLFSKYGPKCIEILKKRQKKVFLDLKYYDIPNTVQGAVKNALELGVDMLNVHACGGVKMMRAAADTAKACNPNALIIAVTVLTSFDQETFGEAYCTKTAISDYASHLAKLAKDSGMDGVVCSSHEISLIKTACGCDFRAVVPGIRPSWERTKDDQKRIMTPSQAVEAGADFLVVGRPVIKAPNPSEAALKITTEMTF